MDFSEGLHQVFFGSVTQHLKISYVQDRDIHHKMKKNKTNKNIGINSRIGNYMYPKQWDVITNPYPNFNGGLVKPTLKLVYGWVITSYM